MNQNKIQQWKNIVVEKNKIFKINIYYKIKNKKNNRFEIKYKIVY